MTGGVRRILSGDSREESALWLKALRAAEKIAVSKGPNIPLVPVPVTRLSAQSQPSSPSPQPRVVRENVPMNASAPLPISPRMGSAPSNLSASSGGGQSSPPKRSPRLSVFGGRLSPRGGSPRSSGAPDVSPRPGRVKSGMYRALGGGGRPGSEDAGAPPMNPPPSLGSSGTDSDYYGWMKKKGKDRWFLLRDDVLYWFTKEQPLDADFRKEVRGSLALDGCSVVAMQADSFSISAPGGSSYLMVCRTARERDDWMRALQSALDEVLRLKESHSMRSGWLEKKKQRRWFVLQDQTVSWYAKEGDVRERGSLNLGECTVQVDDPRTFTLVNLKDDQLRYQLVAKTADEAKEWVTSFKIACARGQQKEADVLKARATARQNAEARGQVAIEKKGWFVKKRKRRYFVLRNTVLMWFADADDAQSSSSMKGSLDMMDCAVTARGFDLNIRATKEGALYVLTAQRKQDVEDWASAIKDAVNAANASSQGGTAGGSKAGPPVSKASAEMKRGWAVKKGKRRFLVLKHGELLYFDREQSGSGDTYTDKPKGSIALAAATASEVNAGSFLVRTEGSTEGLVFETPDAYQWVKAINAFISLSQADSGLSHSGWMIKKGKRRWFALRKGTLMWFNDVQVAVQEEQANGKLVLKRCRVVDDPKSKTITITPHQETGGKAMDLVCYTPSDLSAWLSALKGGQADAAQTTLVDPFASSGKGLVFGRPIQEVLEREGGSVPKIVSMCVDFLRQTALDHPGLFRLSGASGTINSLRDAFDAGEVVDFMAGGQEDEVELDSVAGLLKLYIRQLPEPPLTFALYKDFLAAHDNRDKLRELVATLPEPEYNFCVYMMDFLGEICDRSSVNQMTPSNMAIVMGPNFLRQRDGEGDLMSGLKETPIMLSCFKTLVSEHKYIFG